MKKLFLLVFCVFLSIIKIFATESDVYKGQLPANRKLGPVLLKYLEDGAKEEKEKSNVEEVKFFYKSFNSKDDKYYIEGQEIYKKDGIRRLSKIRYGFAGDGKNFSMQMLFYWDEEVGVTSVLDVYKDQRMNKICKSSCSEISSYAKKMTDKEYEEYSNKINSGRFYSQEVFGLDSRMFCNAESLLIGYWKLTGKKLTRSDYINFLKACRYDTYLKYHDDEFELENQIDNIKKEVDSLISSFDLSAKYQFADSMIFGKYNFEKSGYPLVLNSDNENMFIQKQKSNKTASENSDAGRKIIIKPVNYKDFNFIPVERKRAQQMLEQRKGDSGNVNREICSIITFHFLSADSAEYKQLAKYWNGRTERISSIEILENPIPIAIMIDSIDAFSSFPDSIDAEYIGEVLKD